MRFVFMSLMALSAVALNAQEVEEPTTGNDNSEVVVADDAASSDEDSAN